MRGLRQSRENPRRLLQSEEAQEIQGVEAGREGLGEPHLDAGELTNLPKTGELL